MNLKKKELVISIVLIVLFTIVSVNVSVFATEGNTQPTNWYDYMNNKNSTNENYENVPTNQAPTNENKDNITTPNTTNNANTNSASGNLADTGLEDAPWVIVGICIISAAFAYKKIKEYKLD